MISSQNMKNLLIRIILTQNRILPVSLCFEPGGGRRENVQAFRGLKPKKKRSPGPTVALELYLQIQKTPKLQNHLELLLRRATTSEWEYDRAYPMAAFCQAEAI